MKPKHIAIGVAIYALIASSGLSALSLSVEPTAGTLFGVANEFVYDQSVATNYELSELNWRFQPIYYYGVNINLTTPGGLVVVIAAKSGLSGRVGIMEDSDFQNATYTASGQEVKTLYSQSDNYLERALLAHVDLGYRFRPGNRFLITPLVTLHYMNVKWSARDGYTQYPISTPSETGYSFNSSGTLVPGDLPAWSANLPETPLYGPAVIYRQRYIIPAAGVSLTYTPTKLIEISASIAYSPIVAAQTVDDHVMRQITFTDTFSSGTFLEPALSVRYTPNQRFSVSLGGSYTLITGLVGTMSWQNDGSTSTFPDVQYLAGAAGSSTATNGGGASFNAWDIHLSFRVTM